MAMRLLSPSQSKSRGEIEVADLSRKLVELDGILRDKRLELQRLEALSLRNLSALGKQHYEEDELWKARIDALTNEVTQLEARRAVALVPLQEKENELDTRDSALSKREEQIVLKESGLEYEKDALIRRLDDVSEREQTAADYANTLNSRDFTLQVKEKEAYARQQAMTEALRKTYEEITAAKSALENQKALLKGRDVTITEREKVVAMKEKDIANREIRLADRYRTLQRAITETNLKQNVSKHSPTRSKNERDRNG